MSTTRKQLAEEIGLSEKTMREYIALARATKAIEELIPEEDVEPLQAVWATVGKDRKKGLSMQQVIALSHESPAIITETVKEILQSPNDCKEVVRRKLSQSEVKTMVILPSLTNDYYTRKAKEAGMSKGQYMALILKLASMTEE